MLQLQSEAHLHSTHATPPALLTNHGISLTVEGSVCPSITTPTAPQAKPLTQWQVKKHKLYQELTQVIEYKQKAAQFKALSLQTFAFAERALEKKLAKLKDGETVSLVLDIDDNLIESSSFFGGMLQTDDQMSVERSNEWWQYGQQNTATPMVGALDFVKKYANDKRVNITFLTSRGDHPELKDWTLNMLRYFGFPVKDDQLIIATRVRGNTKAKHIQNLRDANTDILTMGDKLSDSGAAMPEGPANWVHSPEAQKALGRDHIVMSNPLYGYWERITHKNDFDITEETIRRREELQTDELKNEGIPNENKARECLQSLHYIQSASFDAYMIQLANIASDIIDEYQGTPETAGVISNIDGTVLSNNRWRAAMAVKGHVASGQVCLNNRARFEVSRSIASMEPLMKKLHDRKIKTCYLTDRPLEIKTDDKDNTLKTCAWKALTNAGFMSEQDLLMVRQEYNPDNARDKSSRIAKARELLGQGQPLSFELMFGDAMKDLDIAPQSMHTDNPAQWSDSVKEQLTTLGKTRFLYPNPAFSKGWKTHLKQWQDQQVTAQPQTSRTDCELNLRKLRCWRPDGLEIPTVLPAV